MLSKKAAAIPPPATLAIDSKAKEFGKQGFKVINFSAGQLDFPTPKNICQAGKKAIDENFSKYTPVSGIPELKEAIVKKFKRENNLKYNPSQIIVSAGGKQALFNLIFALVDKGDEVILPIPAWVSYIEQIKICDGRPVLLKTGNNFKITANQLDKAITTKTKLLILNSPCNPTGAVYSKKELEALAKVIVKRKIWVIADEVYEKMVYGGRKHISLASLGKKIYQQTLVVNAVSKTYAMTGWRIGYAAGNKKITAACGAFQGHTTANPCSIAQKAALEGLIGPQSFLKKIVKSLDERRKVLVAGLNKIKGIKAALPEGAFYVFADIKGTGMNSREFCLRLLEKEKVALVPGIEFGQEGYVRFSFATSLIDIKEGIRRIKKFVEEKK